MSHSHTPPEKCKRTSVLVIDDSALIRKLLGEIINSSDDLYVIDVAEDPYEAREKIKRLKPDVLTLDIEMPRMDGLTFLANLMRLYPLPVVMVSTLTRKGAKETLNALAMGAVDFVEKPRINQKAELQKLAGELRNKIRMAAKANIRALETTRHFKAQGNASIVKSSNRFDLIAVGSSTGGTEALKTILSGIPTNLPPIVIVQHMPPVFTKSFADRLNEILPLTVIETGLTGKQELKKGHVYIANGASHIVVEKDSNRLITKPNDDEAINHHKPAVDKLFESVANWIGKSSIGVILTGMGNDGAQGIKMLKESGAVTLAQDKETSVVWGMPRAAIELGVIDYKLPLQQISGKLSELCSG